MCFTNNEKKMVYYHIPKCGGNTVVKVICSYYGFAEVAQDTHHLYETFFTDENRCFIDDIQDKHTIRERGKLRYYYTHQDIDPHMLEEYFSFTFVRNPYAKLFSAYCYLNRHILRNPENPTIRGSKENASLFADFNTFVKNYRQVNNISFYHAFISQYEQLITPYGNISINFIGRTENLDNDLCLVLRCMGFNIHPEHAKNIFNEEKKNKTELNYDQRIQDFYNEDSFRFANSHFDKDFELFGYEKYATFEDFKQADLTKTSSNDVHKNCQILKSYLKINENYFSKINPLLNNILELINNQQNNCQINLLKQQIEFMLTKKQNQETRYDMEKKIDHIESQFTVSKPFAVCQKCQKNLWNELAWFCHFSTCV